MKRLILLRHGQSLWNEQSRFTGWTDVELSHLGRKQAILAGQLLAEKGYTNFRIAYSSVLKRAIDSLNLILEASSRVWVDVYKDWRLNEKHYGALQGKGKAEVMHQYGSQQVLSWRRSYQDAPPALSAEDERAPYHDLRYSNIHHSHLPLTESLEQTCQRLQPFWDSTLRPNLLKHEEVLVVAHGNSLRALLKLIKGLNEQQLLLLNIPLALPLIVEFDEYGEYQQDYYLGDDEQLSEALLAASKI